VAVSGAIVAGTKHDDSYLVTMGFAIAYFILFIPGSMVCWYIPVYRAYRSDKIVFCVNIFPSPTGVTAHLHTCGSSLCSVFKLSVTSSTALAFQKLVDGKN